MEREKGIAPRDAHLFVQDGSREDELEDGETLGSLCRGAGSKVLMSLLVEKADAQAVIPGLRADPDVVIEDLDEPCNVAFIPAYPDWIVTTDYSGHTVKISNIRTSALVCKFGGRVVSDWEASDLHCPHGVAVTLDSRPHEEREVVYDASSPDRYLGVAFVLVADYMNSRVQVLQLIVEQTCGFVHLALVRSIGRDGGGKKLEGHLDGPIGVALLPGEGGDQETVLVTESTNHRVSQFGLDGTFIRIFIDGDKDSGWSHSDGELLTPRGITVLESSGEVAVADLYNHRVHIFDDKGNYKRQFGTKGKETDGELSYPQGLTSDAHGNLLVTDSTNRLQVFSPEGKHRCTRSDLVVHGASDKGVAWSADGGLAIANGECHHCRVWGTA
jgi:hypothetical protein